MPLKRLYRIQRARLTSQPLNLRPSLGWRAQMLRWLAGICVLVACTAAGLWFGYGRGVAAAGERLQMETRGLGAMQEKLDHALAQEESLRQQLTVAESARQALASAVATAEGEAAQARQSLSFFDTLLTTNDRNRPVSFAACDLVAADTPNRWRWRLLAVQGVDRAAEFSGQLALIVSYSDAGKPGRVEVKPQPVRFRHYGRLEGEVEFPASAKPVALDARLLMDGQPQPVAECNKKP
ncbi:hypothetical protein IGB42_02581 [Andreprevotia sp. IGB-42]|uniref:DUF6776 family protein n=1 Tax=Andreprevotia sp. IGB-42 TaxID=2497473 RepID=UPI00135C7152|nr:DUF6776 family protein [Andreprevotia sp. IGB-42]KAF0812741.1 hypothetical protein IGB42_02581 [Andreprevotia sp. IGB-42]